MTDAALDAGRALLARLAPDLEAILSDRYDALLPGVPEAIAEWAFGQHYARSGLDLRTRYLLTVAALTAMGHQTAPQLAVNIASALKAGATRREIAEAIWQMAVYGGVPAAISGLNTAREVFARLDAENGDAAR
jgi:4-carboxymuconolactone decarboxylase